MNRLLPGNAPPAAGRGLRVKVFLDFWNFTLSMRQMDRHFRPDYRRLGTVLARAALATVDADARLHYEGMTVYGSYAEGERDAGLRRWFGVVSGFPGVSVQTMPRRRMPITVTCPRPACRRKVSACPECAARLTGLREKGVDVRIATDVIGLAWSDQYDIGVLVSSDGDFVPMAEALNAQNRKIVHGAFPPKAAQLSQCCWASFSVPAIRDEFQRGGHGAERTP